MKAIVLVSISVYSYIEKCITGGQPHLPLMVTSDSEHVVHVILHPKNLQKFEMFVVNSHLIIHTNRRMICYHLIHKT